MPNLRHLTIKADNVDMNGHYWEEIIVKYAPKLGMSYYYYDTK
jgi:hypothetical protein